MFSYCVNAMDNQSVKGMNDPLSGLTLSYTF